MTYPAAVEALLDDLRHAATGAGAPGHCFAGPTRVQFTLNFDAGTLVRARFNAIASPVALAACEAWLRRVEGQTASTMPAFSASELLQKLDLPRDRLTELLAVEDAWRTALRVAQERGTGD